MKIFSILSLLFITSCKINLSPDLPYVKPNEKFEPAPEKEKVDHKVGECFLFIDRETNREKWEAGESNVYVKILEVGKSKYLVSGFQQNYKMRNIGIDKFLLEGKKSIECPKELK